MKRVMFLVNRDFVLYNFRLELVSRLLSEGYEVYICLPNGPKVKEMIDIGCKFLPIKIDKRGTNPIKDLQLINSYRKIIKSVNPDIILMYTTKVVIYGGIIAGMMNTPYLLNVSGLGTAVENDSVIQRLIIFLYKKAVKKASCVFFQNQENVDFFKTHKINVAHYRLIPGSGVNLERWYVMPYPKQEDGLQFLFIARVIKEKGIEEYLKIAKHFKNKFKNFTFHVLGPCDGEYKDKLDKYCKENIIEYHGMVHDTRPFLEKAHCTIHPSYYPEGISNVLLESAACGRPVITTNRPGCKDTVDNNVSGYIFEERNVKDLIEKINSFIGLTWDQKRIMGLAGRRKVEKEFDRNKVTNAYMHEIHRILM